MSTFFEKKNGDEAEVVHCPLMHFNDFAQNSTIFFILQYHIVTILDMKCFGITECFGKEYIIMCQ